MPAKAEGANAAPTPKFLFSDGNYCATFDRGYANLTLIPDTIPAGKACTVFSFSEPGFRGASVESSVSGGCLVASTIANQISAKLVCE